MPEPKLPLKVFLCHAHDDQTAVQALYKRLKKDGVDAWLDKEKLFGGSNWEYEIRKAVRECDVVIVCLSKQFTEDGFRQKEVRNALDEAALKPKEEIFIIPVRLEECDVPQQLVIWHWLDLFRRGGYFKLAKSLEKRALQLQRATVELPKPDDAIPNLTGELKPQQTKNIFVNVDGNIQGNIIIGNENAVQAPEVQPNVEKPAEAKPVIKKEKKGRKKSALPRTKQIANYLEPTTQPRSFVAAKQPAILESKPNVVKPISKRPINKRRWDKAIIVVLIGAAATIIAAMTASPLIGKWLAPTPVPTASSNLPAPNFRIENSLTSTSTPTNTSTPTPTNTSTLTPTLTLTPTKIVLQNVNTISCNWSYVPYKNAKTVNSCSCVNNSCSCRVKWYENNVLGNSSDYIESLKRVQNMAELWHGTCQ